VGRRRFHAVIAVLVTGAAHAQVPPAPAPLPATAQTAPTGAAVDLSPVRILLNMRRAYGGFRSYRDDGVVRTSSVTEDSRFGSETPFSTAFTRPGPLRFEFVDRGLGERSSRIVLWWNGAEVRSWLDAQSGELRSESLRQALEAAGGISGGASLRVPGLLLPTVVGADAPLISPERLPDAVDRGVWCVRLTGKSRATPYLQASGPSPITVQDESITLWLDRSNLLLRRVEDVKTLSTYTLTRTTSYSPEADVVILPDLLRTPAEAERPPSL